MITEGLVVAKPGAPFVYQEINVDENLRDDEVLVQMVATGLCHTDLTLQKDETIPGLHPVVLGHEGAGIVLKIGKGVAKAAVGDHVVLTYTNCGTCKHCSNHDTSFCKDWERDNFGVGRSDGSKSYSSKEGEAITSHFFGQSSFAKHAVVSQNSLVKVDKNMPLKILAPLGCGIMTGAGALLNVVAPSPTSTVLVAGAGAVGLAAIMATKLLPSPPRMIIAVDVVASRLELAKHFGATHIIDSSKNQDLKAAIIELTEGEGVDGAIDCTGRPQVVEALLETAAKKGVVVTVGVGNLSAEVKTSMFNTVNSGRSYVGSCMGNCYPQEFIPRLITAWSEGKFPFTELIRGYPAQNVETAIKEVLDGTAVKAVLTWH